MPTGLHFKQGMKTMPNTFIRARSTAVWILLTTSTALLSACSGEPSSSDVEKAVSANASRGSAQMEQLSRGSSTTFMPQIHGVKKLGCRPETSAAYACDIEVDMTSQGVRGKVPTSMRFIKGSEGWAASR